MGRLNLKDRIALVTGASGGIGAATALRLAERGAIPVLIARRQSELERVAAHIAERTGILAAHITGDIREESDRARLVSLLSEKFGRLDVLVHNAGITAHGRFDELHPSVLRQAMEINFFAVAELTAAVLPLMQKATGERLIALVSTPSGLYGIPGRSAYSAGKAAGHALMEALRMELAEDGIHCTIFCPGYTRTELRTSGLAADGTRLSEEQAKGAKEPDDVARELVHAIERKKRLVVFGLNGRFLYWGRVLFPGLLERLTRGKLRHDFVRKTVPDR